MRRGLRQLLLTALVPIVVLFGLQRGNNVVDLPVPVLLGALLAGPLAIAAHELGHALVAKLVGLEIGSITIGVGPPVWRFEVLEVPVHIHAWPVAGFVYLGAATPRLLRTRAWIATAAGPAANLGLVCATVSLWSGLESVFGGNLMALWTIANFLMFVSAIVPHHVNLSGHAVASNGCRGRLPST